MRDVSKMHLTIHHLQVEQSNRSSWYVQWVNKVITRVHFPLAMLGASWVVVWVVAEEVSSLEKVAKQVKKTMLHTWVVIVMDRHVDVRGEVMCGFVTW